MTTAILRRKVLFILASLFILSTLSACGGGGSSSSGSGSLAGNASLSGNVNAGFAATNPFPATRNLLASVFEMAVPAAHAAGMAGVQVDLMYNGQIVASQMTTDSGDFIFNGLQPGAYTVQLSKGGAECGCVPRDTAGRQHSHTPRDGAGRGMNGVGN